MIVVFIVGILLRISFAIPSSHFIQIPYHRQNTEYSCGDASLEMVLHYFGPDIKQETIVDVMRTTDQGTLSLDMVRGAQFSIISSSIGKTFPSASVNNGYPQRSLGFGAFWYDSQQSWLNQLKQIIANDFPVIVLMHFDANDTGGHFRVVVGYDDNKQQITMNDPWDRDGYPRIAVWSYSKFLTCWNYTEKFSERINPYFGVGIFPWSLSISSTLGMNKMLTIKSRVNYPCFEPFDCSQFPADNVLVSLQFPNNGPYDMEIQSNQVANIGRLNGGHTSSTSWIVMCNSTCSGVTGIVEAKGFIAGSVPLSYVSTTEFYPSYNYVDVIGASKQFIV